MPTRVEPLSRADRTHLADTFGVEPLDIVTVEQPDHDVLRRRARPVRHVNRSMRTLLDRMAATMYRAGGVGLAAPQVGTSVRVIVVDAGDGLHQLVNPEIVHAEGDEEGPEGCLSIPGLIGDVRRATQVRVRALDRDGRESWTDAEGFLARVLQHEIDHLDGVLFTDRAVRVREAAPETRLRVVFMGTAGFSRTVLDDLLEAGVNPVAVVTRPDRPRDRGLRPTPSPVRTLAEECGLRVFTPRRAGDADFLEELRALEPDLVVTAAYGLILPAALLSLPRLGCVNLHPSLLPLYRGAAPISRALWNGEVCTGVTTLYMSEETDAGDIILQEAVDIDPEDDAGSLGAKLASEGARLLRRTLRLLAEDNAPRTPQDHGRATHAPRLTPADEVVDFAQPAARVVGQVRALAPRPGATARWRDIAIKLLRARLWDSGEAVAVPAGRPGEIVALPPGEGIVVRAADAAVLITEIQPAGKRAMTAADFVRGRHPQLGERLEGS